MNSFAQKYGPWAVVTGASSGIGRAIAHELAARRLNIVAIARRAQLLDDLKFELENAYGVQVLPLAVDLTAANAMEVIADACRGMAVGLVVPAAGMASAGSFAASSPEANMAMTQLNVVAPMQIVRLFADDMIRRGCGGVLLISSLFGYQGVPYFALYAATKAYVLLLGEALGHEFRRHGIDVTVLAPGLTDTEMPANLPVDFSKLPMSYQSPERVARTGVWALGRRTTIVPGWRNRIFAWQNRLVPRGMPVWLFGWLVRRALKAGSQP